MKVRNLFITFVLLSAIYSQPVLSQDFETDVFNGYTRLTKKSDRQPTLEAEYFVYPVRGSKNSNYVDPQNDGYTFILGGGIYDCTFGGENCNGIDNYYHTGEDYCYSCASSDVSQFIRNNGANYGDDCSYITEELTADGNFKSGRGKPVYAIANGRIVGFRNYGPTERSLNGMVLIVRHKLPKYLDITDYLGGEEIDNSPTEAADCQTNSDDVRCVDAVDSVYAHLSVLAPDVKVGSDVVAGQLLGFVGRRPHTDHLHHELRWEVDRYTLPTYKSSVDNLVNDDKLMEPSSFIAAHLPQCSYVTENLPIAGTSSAFLCDTVPQEIVAGMPNSDMNTILSENVSDSVFEQTWTCASEERANYNLGETVYVTLQTGAVQDNVTYFAVVYRNDELAWTWEGGNGRDETGDSIGHHFYRFTDLQPGKWRFDFYVERTNQLVNIESDYYYRFCEPIARKEFTVSESRYAYDPDGMQLCTDEPIGGEDTNWVYTCNETKNMNYSEDYIFDFSLSDDIYMLFRINEVFKDYRFKLLMEHQDINGSWVNQRVIDETRWVRTNYTPFGYRHGYYKPHIIPSAMMDENGRYIPMTPGLYRFTAQVQVTRYDQVASDTEYETLRSFTVRLSN